MPDALNVNNRPIAGSFRTFYDITEARMFIAANLDILPWDAQGYINAAIKYITAIWGDTSLIHDGPGRFTFIYPQRG